jgi:methionyl-tRNA formyltransferase
MISFFIIAKPFLFLMSAPLRIVFLGTPYFAVPSLDILVKNGYNIAGVVTAPDKPAGRGQKLSESPVKKYAAEHELKILQPARLKDKNFLEELNALAPDLQVVVAFRMLPEEVWKLPRLGTFNLHASLLPQYRGAAPINWALINGEKETGITTFFLKHEIDTGDVVFQKKISILPEDNAGTLHDRLMNEGAELVLKTAEAAGHGQLQTISQHQLKSGELKTAPKIFKDACRISWKKSAAEIHNLVRGLSPYPAAWTQLEAGAGKIQDLKIFSTSIVPGNGVEENTPGTILTDGKTFIHAVTGKGILAVHELQLAGKKRVSAKEFVNGFNIVNTKFT